MAVSEGLKPLSADQVPSDPNVTVPEHVRRAAAAAEAIHQQAYAPEPDPAAEEAARAEAARVAAAAQVQVQDPAADEAARAEAARVAAEAATHPAVDPKDANISAEEWRHRFLSMQGRYAQASKTIGSMEQQMAELGQELVRTQTMVSQINQRPANDHAQSQVNHDNLITDKDRADYGDELIDLARRAALSATAPEIERMRAENERLTNRVQSTSRRELFATLDTRLPAWRQLNNDVRFKTWLRLPNVYTGQIRGNMLKAAVDGANAPQVLQFFNDFLTEAHATGQMAPAPQVEQRQDPAPRVPAVALESLATPGRARPASGDTQVPSEKPIYSRADISKFYSDSRKGLYAGRQPEYDAIQADLTRAQSEGRIRG